MKLIILLIFFVASTMNDQFKFVSKNKNAENSLAPTNDNPCNATVIGFGTHSGTTFNATTTFNPEATPLCNSTPLRDVWFKTHFPSNVRLSISTTILGSTETPGAKFALYSTGSCSQLINAGICSNGPEVSIKGTVDQEVYIRVWTPFTITGTLFQIKIVNFGTSSSNLKIFPLPLSLIPPNDEPCNADFIAAASSCISIKHNTTDAKTTTNPTNNSLCRGTASKDLWFRTTIPNTRVITLSARTSGFSNAVKLAVYTGNCSSLINTNLCLSGDIVISGEEGTTIFIRAWLFNKLTGKNTSGEFTICALDKNTTTKPTNPLRGFTIPPINDEACNAIQLAPQSTCRFTSSTTEASTLSGNPAPLTLCGSIQVHDLWYRAVIPPGEIMTITTITTLGSANKVTIALYNGTCGALNYTGICTSNQELVVRGLAGSTVFIRLWGNTTSKAENFHICMRNFNVTGSAPINIPL